MESAINSASRPRQSEVSALTRLASPGVLAASIAHEVNQPLSGIVINASTCLRMLSADPPDIEGAREIARRTLRDGYRASEVVTRFRALFGQSEMGMEAVDLNAVVREVIALSVSELVENRIFLRLKLDDALPSVSGDYVQLQQVILNLVRNASDAMRNVDDRRRELTIKSSNDDGGKVRLTVQDTGDGFAPAFLDKLFEAFYTTKNDGMGMGLLIARSIIERHGGRLGATLNDGPGATFSFSIPAITEYATRVKGGMQ